MAGRLAAIGTIASWFSGLASKGVGTIATAVGIGGTVVAANQISKGGAQDIAGGVGEAGVETASFVGAQNANIDTFAAGNASIQWLVGLLAGLADLLGFKDFGDKMRSFRADQQSELQDMAKEAADTNQMDGQIASIGTTLGLTATAAAATYAAPSIFSRLTGGGTPTPPSDGDTPGRGPAIAAADEVVEGVEDVAKDAPRASGRFGKAALGLGLVTAGGTLALTTGDAQAAAPSPDTTQNDVEPVVLEEPTTEGNSWFYDAFQSAATFTTGVATGLVSIPEDLYDAADTYIAQGYLPGDENASGTRDGMYAGAEAIGIDVSNNQGAAALGELSSIFIPVAGIAGAAAKGARATHVVDGIRGVERASDGLGLVDLGSTGAKIARDNLVPSM